MDLVTMARTAREGFARGLGALQTQGVPPPLAAAAEPIAQAMSALHRIESSGGTDLVQAGPTALVAARQALSQLQSMPTQHPAVLQAIEAIAGSLGLVHQIAQQAGQGSLAPVPPTKPSGSYPGAQEAPPQVAVVQPGWGAQGANAVAQTQLAGSQQAWGGQAAQPAAPQAYQPPPQQQAAPQAAPPGATPGNVLRVDADLGAHSTTNFYKGLSGNDVVDSGGIFVATYNIPDIGTPLSVKVSLPGGYEFEALAIVRWTRDSPLSGADGSPGFGAQFTQISPEARQLVYRYVRNREPLFHDDL
ncbi:MAG TPA: PilZ domain-containing protein [Polyangiaceae bacterium]